jgi:hypothetical protein
MIVSFNELNQFQKNVLSKFSQFCNDDFKYFIKETQEKVEQLKRDKKCSIFNTFNDAKEKDYLIAEYCFKNCGLKCIKD